MLTTTKLSTVSNSIENVLNPVLKPIRIDRIAVRVRRNINKLMRTPIRYQNVNLSTRIVETEYRLNDTETITQTSKLEGRIATRIETYQNKQVVLVFTNADDDYLKPFNKVQKRNVN